MPLVARLLTRVAVMSKRQLDRLPFGPWTLPRDQWRWLWKDGGVQRSFLFALTFGLVGLMMLLSFDGGEAALGLLVLLAAALFWRLMIYEVEEAIEWVERHGDPPLSEMFDDWRRERRARRTLGVRSRFRRGRPQR